MSRLTRIGALTATLLCATAACTFAFWSATGAGAGQAGSLATPAPVTISPATTSQELLPTGAATGDVAVTITNPNPFPVHVNQLALDPVQGTSGYSANAAACELSFAPQTNGGAGWDVPATGSLSVDLTNSVTMGTGAASACQGQSFGVYLAAS
jgi:hypothetical protein